MNRTVESDRSSERAMLVLTFDLQGETFALEADLVREVLDVAPETAPYTARGGVAVTYRTELSS